MTETESIHVLLQTWAAWVRGGRQQLPDTDVVRLDAVVQSLPTSDRCVIVRRVVHRQSAAELSPLLLTSTRTLKRVYNNAVDTIADKLNRRVVGG